ncbi:hypothetical protein M9Y10_025795 [Tritrichomonas musculus]|uniref:UBC core domain-containing protein n=1 Tax=Tritrichomonas musculus TaxID=1915356 RepID=A0ABR2H9Q5_9EUKA
MTNLIKLKYALVNKNHQLYMFIFMNTTVRDVLKIISNEEEKNYNFLFYEGSQIDPDEMIYDYWEIDPDYIFLASDTINLPTKSSQLIAPLVSGIILPKRGLYAYEDKKFTFFFTGCDKSMLFKGIEVELNTGMNPDECKEKLFKYIENKIDIKNKQMILYLVGGIPFLSGTLGYLYMDEKLNVKNYIYGVIIKETSINFSSNIYERHIIFNNTNIKLILSSLCESTEKGLIDMICLLIYLCNSKSENSKLFLLTSSFVINFPPFVASLNNAVEHNNPNKRDIVTIFATLHTFFKGTLPFNCDDECVFEYGLKICNLIANINDKPTKLPNSTMKLDKDKENQIFLKSNSDDDFLLYDFNPSLNDIENSYDFYDTFAPIDPLSNQLKSDISIVKGRDHQYIIINNHRIDNKVDVYDPVTDNNEFFYIDFWAKLQKITDEEDMIDLFNPDVVKQIIMFDIDESVNMDDESVIILQHCLLFVVNKLFSYDEPSFYGAVSYNSDIQIKCPFTFSVEEFEGKSLKDFQLKSKAKLWDSISFCCEEIFKFRKNILGEEIYKNAVSRIIVISSGEDLKSSIKIENLIKELIKNKIVVDCIILNSSSEDQFKNICTVCHLTGGLALHPKNLSEILSIFENSSFINFKEREINFEPLIQGDRETIPILIKPSQITKLFIEKINKNQEFDAEIRYKGFKLLSSNPPLITPECYLSKNKEKTNFNSRIKRILSELQLAKESNDSNSLSFNPDIKIFPFKSLIDNWKVFFLGPEGTSYSGKWFYLHVFFPDEYPLIPPIIRFISVPCHFNVSSDGRLCLDILDKKYNPDMHVVSILVEIVELLLLPNMDTIYNLELYMIKKDNHDYEKMIVESTSKVGKSDYRDFIDASFVETI